MRSARRPPTSIERVLVLVLAGFIAVDLLLVVPAFVSELRLDRLHPSLPIVNLRPLAAGRARIADGLGEEFTAPVQRIAGELEQAGAKVLDVVFANQDPAEPDSQKNDGSIVIGPSPPATQTPDKDPSLIPSYTPTSTSIQTQQIPSMTPSQVAVVTATVICATIPTTACQSTSSPTPDPTTIPTSTPLPTATTTAGSASSVPAFPGAEGFGAESVGGRGGRVIEVTNLNDSGPGSLRAAIGATGPRIVVFRVAGVIRLESALRITQPFITIAGQTAPGGGITLVDERIIVSTHNVIIRYLRWRGGHNSFLIMRPWNDLHDVIVDHCSASWAEGNIIGIWFGDGNEAKPDMQSITIQNCLIAEPLAVHPTGLLAGAGWTESVDLIEHLHHVSVHHNLFAHSGHRNPRIKAQYTEVINNVVFNWSNRVGGTDRASIVDWIGNYFRAGLMTSTANDGYLRHLSVNSSNWDIVHPTASLYVVGNVAPERGHTDADADNWWMVTEYGGPNKGETIAETHRRHNPLDPAPIPVTIQSAYDAYGSVISEVGANARLDSLGNWVSNRDTVDLRFLSDVQIGTGPSHISEIDKPGDIGLIDSGTPYDDSDHDGMADEWEQLYCFDPNDPSDGPEDADGDGYTNVEEFLNGTQPTAGGPC